MKFALIILGFTCIAAHAQAAAAGDKLADAALRQANLRELVRDINAARAVRTRRDAGGEETDEEMKKSILAGIKEAGVPDPERYLQAVRARAAAGAGGRQKRQAAEEKVECAPYEFTCASGECVHLHWRCDTFDDCKDKSDETAECDICQDGDYPCTYGYCLPKNNGTSYSCWCDYGYVGEKCDIEEWWYPIVKWWFGLWGLKPPMDKSVGIPTRDSAPAVSSQDNTRLQAQRRRR